MRQYNVLMLVVALMLLSVGAYARPTTFTTNLTQAQEIPTTGSTATGSATIVLDPTANTLSVHATFSGLTSNTAAAHIHCCLASLFANANVGVATTMPAFPGFPLNVKSGTYDGVLDLNSPASYNPAFVTLQGGTVAGARAALIKGIQNGETYFNIHTAMFPSGEIRGLLAASPTSSQIFLLKTIPINGTAANRSTNLFSFDISFVDNSNGLYYLADRSNAAIDVVDTTGAFTGTPDTLFGQIGGPAVGFQGDTGNNNTSGPDGVAAFFPCIFAGDGNSRVVSFNGAVNFTVPVTSFNTGGAFRADEMAFDPKDRLLLAINNADDPPFGTLINVSPSCVLDRPKTIFFTKANGVDAQNGAEQPVWDPGTQRFYVSIPQIGPNAQNGGVIKINPIGGAIEAVYPINFVTPAGLTLGPNGDLLVGSNMVFDASGNPCKNVVPGSVISPVGVPATCTGIAAPQVAICNPGKGCTGNSLVSVPGVGGGDEVWYNSGDGNYYVTAANDPVGPSLGAVGSVVNTLTQLGPTLPPVPAVTTGPNKHGAGTVHSVAASAANNHVYVPLPANNSYPNCAQGCIAVLGVP